jgi:hypothetical protein
MARFTERSAMGWTLAALLLGLAGCGGAGASGTASPASAAAVPQGQGAPTGGGKGDDDDPTLADRAARGLTIGPPIDTTGMSKQQKLLVGLGSYIVNAASDCSGCHSGPAGFLAGGNAFNLPLGQVVYTRNLTPDPATGLQLSLRQFVEAVRTGRDFHPGAAGQMVVMPWTTLRWASDLDLQGIYAYLRAIPAVSNEVPEDQKAALGLPPSTPFPGHLYTDGAVVRLLTSSHQSFDPLRGLEVSPLPQPRKLRGEALESYGVGSYIANTTAHCNDCHTHPDRTADQKKVNVASFLAGGTVFATPPPFMTPTHAVRATSANLKGAVNGFFNEPDDSYDRFKAIMSTGTLVDEDPPRPLAFPMSLVAPNLALLLEADLRAVYDYMKGSPSTTGASDVEHQPPARACQAASDCLSGEACTADTHECVGGACGSDLDCGTCQTCGGGTCQEPAGDSLCLLTAQ